MQITESLLKSIMDQYESSLYRMCLSILKRTDSAHDVVIETFEKLWFMRDQVQNDKIKAFLFLVAKNRCLDVYRNQNWERSQVFNMPHVDSVDPIGPIDCRDILNTSFKIVSNIRRREGKNRSIDTFLNTYVHDLTGKEIGNVSTVTSTRQYFIQYLRRSLRKEIILKKVS